MFATHFSKRMSELVSQDPPGIDVPECPLPNLVAEAWRLPRKATVEDAAIDETRRLDRAH